MQTNFHLFSYLCDLNVWTLTIMCCSNVVLFSFSCCRKFIRNFPIYSYQNMTDDDNFCYFFVSSAHTARMPCTHIFWMWIVASRVDLTTWHCGKVELWCLNRIHHHPLWDRNDAILDWQIDLRGNVKICSNNVTNSFALCIDVSERKKMLRTWTRKKRENTFVWVERIFIKFQLNKKRELSTFHVFLRASFRAQQPSFFLLTRIPAPLVCAQSSSSSISLFSSSSVDGAHHLIRF